MNMLVPGNSLGDKGMSRRNDEENRKLARKPLVANGICEEHYWISGWTLEDVPYRRCNICGTVSVDAPQSAEGEAAQNYGMTSIADIVASLKVAETEGDIAECIAALKALSPADSQASAEVAYRGQTHHELVNTWNCRNCPFKTTDEDTATEHSMTPLAATQALSSAKGTQPAETPAAKPEPQQPKTDELEAEIEDILNGFWYAVEETYPRKAHDKAVEAIRHLIQQERADAYQQATIDQLKQGEAVAKEMVVDELEALSMAVVESCEPDCNEVRHALHQGSWLAHLVIEARIAELRRKS